MSSDISRQRFDPFNDFSAVLMQQGRVLLDSDWNELIEILGRRLRAETVDIIGRGVVPKETPHGFEIALAAGKLTIGPGRIYVDGLLAENHGAAPMEFDPVLAELRGTKALAYDEQPYLPNAANDTSSPREGGPHLAYLDVWQREVTAVENPDLVESAVGVDSTTRWQTVWQVRLLGNVGADVTCSTPDAQVPGWVELTHPSDGRLTTDTTAVPPSDDLCLIPPTGGYRGLENRLYRVEIHAAGGVGGAGAATFKWARHDASVATSVRQIKGEDLVVDLIGHDADLRFRTGDWIEITDDVREFALRAGEMRKIKNVTDSTRTITIDGALPADFPTDASNNTDAARHTRIRRWEQKGQVRDTNGNVLTDLNAAGTKGVIPVPAAGAIVVLEDGITVALTTEPVAGKFRVGDYWVFTARASDASIEKLNDAVPRGIHHHYCRLGLVTFPGTVTDCRVFWPPAFGGEECCDCTVCVTPESHRSGTLTIQQAIDQVAKRGGTVCLDVGIYPIDRSPVLVKGARSLRIRGQGWKTILTHVLPGPAVIVQDCFGLTVENLAVLTAGGATAPADIAVTNSAAVNIERCWFLQAGTGDRPKAAIGLGGFLIHARLRDNAFLSAIGIGNLVAEKGETTGPAAKLKPLITLGLSLERNQMLCARAGISLEQLSVHLGETSIAGNFVEGSNDVGVRFTGAVLPGAWPGSQADIVDNTLHGTGDGIVTGTDNTRINGNDIGASKAQKRANGIALTEGLLQRGGDAGQLIGNRISGLNGDGIAIVDPVGSWMIKQNVINHVVGGGIVMYSESRAAHLSIENNQLFDIANVTAQESEKLQSLAAIQLVRVHRGDVSGNVIDRVALQASLIRRLAGIQSLSSSHLRIFGNRIANLGTPTEQRGEVTAIAALGTFNELSIGDNSVRRSDTPPAGGDISRWRALRIGQPKGVVMIGGSLVFYVAGIAGLFGNGTAFINLIAPEHTSVRGNSMVIYGSMPAVEIFIQGPCTVSDNQVSVLPDAQAPALILTASAAIVSNNLLEAVRGDAFAVELTTEKGTFTVLGNITSARVLVNNAPLSDPWRPLNIIAP